MKNDVENANLTRERMLWVGALILTAAVFLFIGLSSPLSFSNMRGNAADVITIEKVNSTTTANTSTTVTVAKVTSTTAVASTATPSSATVSGKVNINTATVQELMTVPGIGEVFAQRIVEYRDAHDGFSTLEDLLGVKGVGEGRYNSWSPYLTVG